MGWFVHPKHAAEAGISKNYYATNSGSPEVELRFCPWLTIIQYCSNVELGCQTRARIFKLLRSSRIDSEEPIPPRAV